ncbi:MAG: radical SAM protein [Candidatus Margulisiibacteriota bacterium]
MDKILFIVPLPITYDDFVHPAYNAKIIKKKNGGFASVLTDMPLGVLSMSAYIKKHATVETKLIDFNIILNKLEKFEYGSFTEFFYDYLSSSDSVNFAPDIICISALFTPAYFNMLEIAQCCRKIFPKAIITAGGGVPTNLYREIYSNSSCFDALCYGEGERALLDLVKAENKRQCLEDGSSWITRSKIENNQAFKHDFIVNLDEIPFYDYDICKTKEYGLNPAIEAYSAVDEKKQNFHVMTSRGCPYRCIFCASHSVHGRKMRYFSIGRVMEDFRRLRDEYGAKTLVFQDDHFVADRERALAILKIVKGLNITAVFQNGLALYALDRPMLEALKTAGLDQLVLALESGSDRVLKEIMHKPLNLSMVKPVADNCRELGIYMDVNILIGLPGETKKDIEDTRDFLKTINANWFRITVATPLVGSEMFDICVKKKYIKGNYIDCHYKKAIIETEDFTAEYLQEKAYLLNLELNFVENSDLRLGNYAVALKGFENAIRAKSNHAIAYYCASKCYENLGDHKKAQQYMDTAKKIVKEAPLWRRYADMFNVPI